MKTLGEEEVRFLLVGGMAVVAHGYGRMTFDVDLVIQLNPDNVQKAFLALKGLGYEPRVPVTAEQFGDRKLREAWIREKRMVVLNFYSNKHTETTVDIFVQEPFDFEQVYEKSVRGDLDGIAFRYVDLATLVEMKKAAGRPQDLLDVEKLKRLDDDEKET